MDEALSNISDFPKASFLAFFNSDSMSKCLGSTYSRPSSVCFPVRCSRSIDINPAALEQKHWHGMPKLRSRLRSRKEKRAVDSAAPQPRSAEWLTTNGLKQLELLFRAIVYQPAEPILIADNDRNYRDASCGAAKLLGLPRSKIIGRRVDDFAE